jgi:hypothetical protein
MLRFFCCTALLLFAFASGALAQSRGLGYAVDSDDSDHLWAVDLSSGNTADLGPTGIPGIEALAFHPDGRLFGIDDAQDRLVVLDLATGAASVVGSLGAEVENPGFAIDATGAAWLASDNLASGSQPFYAVDLATGAASLVGEQGRDLQGLMAIGRALYGINDEEPGLFRVDPRRGTATRLATLLAPFQGECPSLEAAPNGDWIALNDAGAIFLVDPATGDAGLVATTRAGFESLAIPHAQVCAYSIDSDVGDQLHVLDLLTGANVAIGPVGFTDVEGLAFAPDGRLFGIDDDGTPELVEIDLGTGAGRAVGALGVAISNPGFAIDASGQGYVISDTPSGPVHRLDLSNGQATFIGNSGLRGIGLAFLRGELLALDFDPDQLARIDTTSGAGTPIGALVHVGVSCGGLDAASDGSLWALDDGGRILRLGPSSGTALHVASTLPGCESLAIPAGCGGGPFDARITSLELELPLPPVDVVGAPEQSFEIDIALPFATLPADLSGYGVELFANGIAISPVMVLDAKGRGRSSAGGPLTYDIALSAKKRTLSAELAGLDFRSILGLPSSAGAGSSIVALRARVRRPVEGLPTPLVAQSRVPIRWENLLGNEITGGYAPKSDGPNLTGFASATQVRARQVGNAHDLSFRGTLLPNGGGALLPAFPDLALKGGALALRVTLGAAEPIEIPATAIAQKGAGSKAQWGLAKGAVVPGLAKLSYRASTGALSFSTTDVQATGIPLVGAPGILAGGPLSHPFEVLVDVRTAGGWQSFRCGYLLTRKSPETTSWK